MKPFPLSAFISVCAFISGIDSAEYRRGRVVTDVGYAVKGREFEPYFGQAATRKLCKSNYSKWVPFSNKGRIRQRKVRDEFRLSYAVPEIQWGYYPNAPTVTSLWAAYTLPVFYHRSKEKLKR